MMRGGHILASALILVSSASVRAVDYGSFGALFPVEEPSVLETILGRLRSMEQSGELDAMREDMQNTVRARVARPRPVEGLLRAETYRTFEVDLSITVTEDLADHNGVVFARAGTVVNPLDHSRFAQRLVFIDGDDEAQVTFAVDLARTEPSKIILVNGAPFELTDAHKLRFYFDQSGSLANRFHLRAVPAVVSRGARVMIVEEIPLEENTQ